MSSPGRGRLDGDQIRRLPGLPASNRHPLDQGWQIVEVGIIQHLIDILAFETYIKRMRLWLFRYVVVIITLGAFLSAGLVQAAWPVQAAASHDVTKMADGDAPMPCKGMTPACMTDLGCIFMIGMPTVSPAISMTRLSWSRVSYGELFQLVDGLTKKPALDPPIFLS